MKKFKFNLGEAVTIIISGEKGTILGRCECVEHANSYWVRYKNAEGRAVEYWWIESALDGTLTTVLNHNEG